MDEEGGDDDVKDTDDKHNGHGDVQNYKYIDMLIIATNYFKQTKAKNIIISDQLML